MPGGCSTTWSWCEAGTETRGDIVHPRLVPRRSDRCAGPRPSPCADFSTRPPSASAMTWWPKQIPTSFALPFGGAQEGLELRDPGQVVIDPGRRAGDQIGVVAADVGRQRAGGDVVAPRLEPEQRLEHRRIAAEFLERRRRRAGLEDGEVHRSDSSSQGSHRLVAPVPRGRRHDRDERPRSCSR